MCRGRMLSGPDNLAYTENESRERYRRHSEVFLLLQGGDAPKTDCRAAIQSRPQQEKLGRIVSGPGAAIHVPMRPLRGVIGATSNHAESRATIRTFTFCPFPHIAAEVITPERRSPCGKCPHARCPTRLTAVAPAGLHRVAPRVREPFRALSRILPLFFARDGLR